MVVHPSCVRFVERKFKAELAVLLADSSFKRLGGKAASRYAVFARRWFLQGLRSSVVSEREYWRGYYVGYSRGRRQKEKLEKQVLCPFCKGPFDESRGRWSVCSCGVRRLKVVGGK